MTTRDTTTAVYTDHDGTAPTPVDLGPTTPSAFTSNDHKVATDTQQDHHEAAKEFSNGFTVLVSEFGPPGHFVDGMLIIFDNVSFGHDEGCVLYLSLKC